MYKADDIIDTKTYGLLTVLAPITFKPNNNPRFDKLGGKTLYWLQKHDNDYVYLWDDELSNDLTDEEIINSKEPIGDNLLDI